jgi:hypothetical protein
MVPVCLDDLLHAIRLDTSDVVHDCIDSAFFLGRIFDVLPDFITNASVAVISSTRNIA